MGKACYHFLIIAGEDRLIYSWNQVINLIKSWLIIINFILQLGFYQENVELNLETAHFNLSDTQK